MLRRIKTFHLPARAFCSSVLEFQSAPLHPLLDNEHLRPSGLRLSSKKQGSWVWITGINSAVFRPAGWSAHESTIEVPWTEITGNPLRMYFVTKDTPKKGYFNVGLSISAYCLDRQRGKLSHLVKSNNSRLLVDSVLAPMRFSDGKVEPGKPPNLLPGIEILSDKIVPADSFDRFPIHSTRFSYIHSNYVPDAAVGLKPIDMRFELEWAANDRTGWVYELVFQAPVPQFEEVWNEVGKFMMSTDKGHFLSWQDNAA